jgi:hypothetical protein
MFMTSPENGREGAIQSRLTTMYKNLRSGFTRREPPVSRLKEMKEKLKALFVEYGAIAVVIHLTLFGLVFLAFYMGISLGREADDGSQGAGTLVAAYIAAQLTKPIRILIVLTLTPVVAQFLPDSLRDRLRGKKKSSENPAL